ncbi:MAG: hypothetical protein KRP56_04355 [Candidatus Methanogranum gryphiswaldense]|nr:MAG: hypothetical protein KRP56_04355 [Candidatus Methanogranum sp. U3.2.1]
MEDKAAKSFVIAILLISLLFLGTLYALENNDGSGTVKWTLQSGVYIDEDNESGNIIYESDYDLVVNTQNNGLFQGTYGKISVSGQINDEEIWFQFQFPTMTIEFLGVIYNGNTMVGQVITCTDSDVITAYNLIYTNDGSNVSVEFEDIDGLSALCDKAVMAYGKNEFENVLNDDSRITITNQIGGVFYGSMDQNINGEKTEVVFVGTLIPTEENGDFTAECCDINGEYWCMNVYGDGECITMTGCFESNSIETNGALVTVEQVYFLGTPDYSLIPTPIEIGNSEWVASEITIMHSNGDYTEEDIDCSITFFNQEDELIYAYLCLGSTEETSMAACMTYDFCDADYFLGMMDMGKLPIYIYGGFIGDDTLVLYFNTSDGDDYYTTQIVFENKSTM